MLQCVGIKSSIDHFSGNFGLWYIMQRVNVGFFYFILSNTLLADVIVDKMTMILKSEAGVCDIFCTLMCFILNDCIYKTMWTQYSVSQYYFEIKNYNSLNQIYSTAEAMK